MDLVILIEIFIIIVIAGFQINTYRSNLNKISNLEWLYPDKHLEIVSVPDQGGYVELINIHKRFSEGFKAIAAATNLYLHKNKGAAADFNILRDISERESDALENEIDTTLALPLYIGLMGTFLGVIIGLVRIAFLEGINDASIRTFLGGVLVGMAASALGLFLTTISNISFRKAKLSRDRYKNNYYTFLQAELLPSLTSNMAGSLTTLKDNLSAFNSEFSNNLANFKGSVESISANLTLQKDFLNTLDRVGYNTMAAANIEVFERIERSQPVFHSFINSIKEANLLTQQAKDSFEAIRQIMNDLRGFREGINGLGQYIKENDNLIDKQVKYLNAYIDSASYASESMGKHFDKADDAITKFVNRRIDVLMQDSQRAAVQLEEYFDKLKKDNVHVELARHIDALKDEISNIVGEVNNIYTNNQLFNKEIYERLAGHDAINRQLLTELDQITKKLIDVNILGKEQPAPVVAPEKTHKAGMRDRIKDALINAGLVFFILVMVLLFFQLLAQFNIVPAFFYKILREEEVMIQLWYLVT
jgi:hypothetical protein